MELTVTLIVAALVIVICVISNKITLKIGVPMLFAFILLGMIFGSDGLFRIEFADFAFAEQICTVALIFIMFYGGFGTNWHTARKTAPCALLLSTVGVVLTAVLTGLFCFFVLRFELLESFLIGAVLSSTDAASVFSILRSRKLGLKDGTASILELESGSNDPVAYMLTLIILTAMSGDFSAGDAILTLILQIVVGYVGGSLIAVAAAYILRQFRFGTDGFETIFTLAIALLSYALPALFGGNGYLSAYIVGIVLGNQPIASKKTLVNFFDALTGLMQILVFFLLGLLSFPSQMPAILVPSILIALFLTFVSRPLATVAIMSPFKAKWRQQGVVAWAGLRGATSIVFAVMAQVSSAYTENDVFHITFCIVLLSIGIQGSLLPWVARMFRMIDTQNSVMRTFSDYNEESEAQFIRIGVPLIHPWNGKALRELQMPPNMLVALIERGEERIVPNGDTRIMAKDVLVLGAVEIGGQANIPLTEQTISAKHPWRGKTLREATPGAGVLVMMVKRHGRLVIPNGSLRLRLGDTMIVAKRKRRERKPNLSVQPKPETAADMPQKAEPETAPTAVDTAAK